MPATSMHSGCTTHNMRPVTTTPGAELCGLCGQPIETHDASRPDHKYAAGRRVEYVVIRIQDGLADSQAVDDPADKPTNFAAVLAESLTIDEASLNGRHYTCLVVVERHRRTYSDFRLVPTRNSVS